MNDSLLLIIMAGLFTVSIIVILIIVLNNAKKTNDLNNELTRSVFEIQKNISHDFSEFNRSLNNDFSNFSERVNSNIIQSHKSTSEVFNRITEKIARIDEAQKNINALSEDVVSLQNILTDKKSRGTFGEIELYSLLEASFGNNTERYQKQYRLPNGSIADAVIFGGNSLKLICIDSKFPLENYRRMNDSDLPAAEKEKAKKQFKEDIKKHLNDIASKYIVPGITADLAYMFIPAEAVFSQIYTDFYELVELSYQLKVYIVSPTTLMAYITAIRSIYLGQLKDEKAREIEKLLSDLSIEFQRYEKRTNELFRAYESLGTAFHNLNTTSDKIMKRFDRINSGDIEE